VRILLLDNADSFTFNIAQYLYEVTGVSPLVMPNTTPYAELPLDQVSAIVISPGPGRPSRAADFGVCREVIARSGLPLLGICLGHQGVAEFFGGRTVHAPEPVHGVVDTVKHSGTGLFAGLPQDLPVVRYHSLVVADLPAELEVTAWTGDGLIMALAHRTLPMWGVQFHPESIASLGGHELLANFVALAARHADATMASPAPDPEPSAAVAAFRRVGGAARQRLDVRPVPAPAPPEEVFQTLCAGRPHAFWLDSENSTQPGSRYSLMGAGGSPGSVALSYNLAERRLTLTGADLVEHVTGDVFTMLEEIVSSVDVRVPDDWPLAFTGGLVGYLGYELKALTTGAEVYHSPQADAWFLHTRNFVVFDHEGGLAFECTLVGDGDPGLERTESAATAKVDAPPELARPAIRPSFTPGPVDPAELGLRDDHDSYVAKIVRAQELIVDGETYEVCLTNCAHVTDVGDGLNAYGRMRAVSPVPYGAYLRCGDVEVLSSSPETFLRIDAHGVVESRPIKGTRPRGRTAAEDEELRRDLLASTKDRAENLMIVDLVRHDLNAVSEPGSVHVPELFGVQSYSSVHQLVSTVRGRLRWGTSALAAVRACFPGGSMTGAPKQRTMEIIDELEGGPRGIYSGSVGWLSFSGALDLSIVIRTAVVLESSASFGVGGAITAQSDPEAEVLETLVKASVPHHGLRAGRGVRR